MWERHTGLAGDLLLWRWREQLTLRLHIANGNQSLPKALQSDQTWETVFRAVVGAVKDVNTWTRSFFAR